MTKTLMLPHLPMGVTTVLCAVFAGAVMGRAAEDGGSWEV
jgi:hypothetical protein